VIPLVQWGLCFLAGAGAGLLAPDAWMPFFILLSFLSASLLGLGFLHAGLKGTRPVLAALLFFALGALRASGEEAAFDRQQSLFPGSVTGSFRGTIVEDPEVLFEHAAGGHETGRTGDSYAPPVDRARAVVEISGLDGRPLGPVKVRCSFACPKQGGARVLSYGDEVEIRGRLSLPPVAMSWSRRRAIGKGWRGRRGEARSAAPPTASSGGLKTPFIRSCRSPRTPCCRGCCWGSGRRFPTRCWTPSR
jgi:hypothetical protein